MKKPVLLAAVAFALCATALVLAGVGLPEYSHRLHPVALRGATGVPDAWLFNVAAFVLPGLLLAWAGQSLGAALREGRWGVRIGLTLVQLSALAFALQGALPLDPEHLDTGASRLHAVAWALWWIAFVPGTLLLALSAKRGLGFAAACLAVAVLLPLFGVLAPVDGWVGFEQRLALALWFCWWLLAARSLSGTSASAPGSSSPAGR
ncbi:MAG: DUF998 domain-containing protein [Thermomonas sp.]|uniref:DUF998 domain-containing protein n=1 Tax=Thermomonas sp. TaxID=1971895 RepID=UPI002614E3F8|nr:DUF998 domain-containing protein [Thermomonas sp.]MCC7097919.1 DUF998 domain-containing protein [Thermomonas sp.]